MDEQRLAQPAAAKLRPYVQILQVNAGPRLKGRVAVEPQRESCGHAIGFDNLAEHAARTESERQIVPEVMHAVEEAGLFEVIVPKRLGGLGASMATQLCVAAELGKACPSTAWVQSLLNVTTWAATQASAATFCINSPAGCSGTTALK